MRRIPPSSPGLEPGSRFLYSEMQEEAGSRLMAGMTVFAGSFRPKMDMATA
jgi:hypothetical protein